ncbi:hypothetical protein BG015_010275 [Linnemannia schmuckeri]|uniref:HCP-like protein n=1 Tax=Linnemannia schmuckeri TaxID=64567 RepID=A0A9P5RU75_9FUNG|nr:hypothetical protein BG015_010275 [Linnemannia schmuckeri]
MEPNAKRLKVDLPTNQPRPLQNDTVPSSASSSRSPSLLPSLETYPQDSNAQITLGRKYREGDGIEQDYQAAMSLFLKAAEQGNVEDLRWAGHMYAEGLNVPQDFTMTGELYCKAAEHGDPTAQLNLGILYDKGEGVQQDFTKAMEQQSFKWTTPQGSVAKTQASIAHMYVEGRGGVLVDLTKAAEWHLKATEWHLKAAERGLSTAQHHIACSTTVVLVLHRILSKRRDSLRRQRSRAVRVLNINSTDCMLRVVVLRRIFGRLRTFM